MFYKFVPFIAFTAFALSPLVIAYYLRKRYKELMLQCKPSNGGTYSFIFVSYENRYCRMHLLKSIACSEKCSYKHLVTILRFMESAKTSISMCMCILALNEIQNALIRAHNRGVLVRYISDVEMLRNLSTRKDYLKGAGIPIKAQPDVSKLLHHKFCLVDECTEDAKMLFGSLNLTCQGLTCNWDLTVLTTDQRIIRRYQEEFDYLWDSFDYV